MAVYHEIKHGKTFIGRLKFGGDLLDELTSVCEQNDIRLGRVEALGALKKARIGFFNQQARKYNFIEIDKPLEITGFVGNISLRDGKPMVHAHITLSDSQGNAYGGHLVEGTIVLACEFIMNSYDGPDLIRDYDEQTDLVLWKF